MASFGFSISDIVLICNYAQSVYRSMKNAGEDFKSIATDVKSLRSYLRSIEAELQDNNSLIHRSSRTQQRELSDVVTACRSDLQDLKRRLWKYQSLRTMFPRARDRAGFTPNKQAEIKERINTHSDRLNRVLTAIQTSSLGRLENKVEDVMTKADLDTVMSRLNEIHSDVLRGRRAHSILTDGDEWSILEQELLGDDNITEVDVAVNRDEILLWLERVRNSKDLQDLLQGVSQYGGSVRDDSNSDENGRNTPVNADGAHCAVVEEADDSEEGEEQEEVMTGRIDVQDLDETNQDDDSRHEQAEDEKREHDEENEDQTDESEVEAVQNDEESEEEQSAGGESKWEESETGDERVEESNIKLVEESENEIKGEESEADKSDVTMENQPEECEGEETEESEDEHVGQSNDRESERGEDSGVANQSDDTQAEESENENEQITEREDEQVEESEIESTEESELEESESEQGEDSECDSEQIEESANRPTGETETRQIEEAQATRSSETEGERVQESQDERSDEAESKQIEEDQHGQCGEGQVSENRAEQLDERERNQVQEILEIPYHIPEGQETNQTTDESLGGEDSSSDVGSDTSFRTAIHVSTSTPESEVLTDEEEQTEGEGFYTGDDRSWTEDDIAWTEDDWTDNEEEPERPLDINITPLTAACTWYPGTQVVGDPESNKSFVWLPGAFAFPPPEVEMVIRLHISLEEAYYGTTRKINLTRSVWDDETQSTRSETSPINLDMQKGIMDGSWVRYDGMGNEGQNTSQDLIFIVSEKSHPFFSRFYARLHCTYELSITEALTGWARHVRTIDGFGIRISCRGPTKQFFAHWLPQLGMPRIDNPNERGYLVVKFEVHCPDTFTLEQKDKMYEVLALSQTQVEADVVECPAGVDIIAYRARFKELCEQMKNDPEYWMHVYR